MHGHMRSSVGWSDVGAESHVLVFPPFGEEALLSWRSASGAEPRTDDASAEVLASAAVAPSISPEPVPLGSDERRHTAQTAAVPQPLRRLILPLIVLGALVGTAFATLEGRLELAVVAGLVTPLIGAAFGLGLFVGRNVQPREAILAPPAVRGVSPPPPPMPQDVASSDTTSESPAPKPAAPTRDRNIVGDAAWDWNLIEGVVDYSQAWKDLLGLEDTEVTQRPEEWFDRVHADDLQRVQGRLVAHVDGDTPEFEEEFRMIHRDGSHRWLRARGQAVRQPGGVVERICGSLTDLTGRNIVDSLTGLPNAQRFQEQLEDALARVRRTPEWIFAVLVIDIDRFKSVNDGLGHTSGDRLLVAIAERIQKCLRPRDTVARSGGDEFMVLLADLRDVAEAEGIAERIQEECARPHEVDGHEIYAPVSIGITPSTKGYREARAMLRDADTALRRAKAGDDSAKRALFHTQMRLSAVRSWGVRTEHPQQGP